MPEVRRIKSFRSRRKTQVAAYVRVSTSRTKQDESYENQAVYYEQLIKSNPDWEFVAVYGDQVSGTHAENREQFQQMITDALEGKIDLIIVKSVSRWSRNMVDGLTAIKLLTGNGIHVLFEEQGIDTRTPGIILPLNLAQSVAQAESESISENMKWLYRNRAEQGKFWANPRWYFGYDAHGDEFVPNDDAEHVKFIYDSFLSGMTPPVIAEKLNEMGVKTVSGGEWKGPMVRRVLSHEVYVGDIIFRKTPSRHVITGEIDPDWEPRYVADHHVPIITREMWTSIQEKLKEPTKRRASSKPREKKEEKPEPKAAAPTRTSEPRDYKKWNYSYKKTKEQEVWDKMDQVTELVKKGYVTITAISEKMGIPKPTAQYYLKKLVGEGTLLYMGGYWAASPEDEKPERKKTTKKGEEMREQVLDFIRQGVVKALEMEKRTGINRNNLQYYIRKLAEEGRICRVGENWVVNEESSSV